MKALLFIFLLSSASSALYLSDTLPKESVQLIDSFECFSNDDKTVLHTYLLALQYRIDHVDHRDDLVKTELDYWRLWHLVSDLEQSCKLHYDFSRTLEQTVTPSQTAKQRLNKLRRVEGSIRVDGASESSERMRKYDANLRKSILQAPPEFKVLDKNSSLPDYDLTTLKKLPKNTIPESVYENIEKQHLSGVKKDLLLHYTYLREEMIRQYDRPKERYRMKQELVYLEACQKYHGVYANGNFYSNHKRKIARVGELYSHYYPLQTEFLPKELETYCENNITKITVAPFKPDVDKVVEAAKKSIVFKKSRKHIDNYRGDLDQKQKMQAYIKIVEKQMNAKGDNLIGGLQLARLSDCFKKDDTDFIKAVHEDVEQSGMKDEYSQKVLRPQLWWAMTIGMKIDQEGESDELKHFFDCNQTDNDAKLSATPKPIGALTPQRPKFDQNTLHRAIDQKDSILKYYAKTFENRPSPDIDNTKAVKAGIIEKKWLDEKRRIIAPIGKDVTIQGISQGGMKLTYTQVPKGELCTQFIQLNRPEHIYFNSKTYEGIDYILLNGHKIKMQHYVYKQVQRLCEEQETNTISFVKETPSKLHTYSPKPLDNAYENAEHVQQIPGGGNKIVLSANGQYLVTPVTVFLTKDLKPYMRMKEKRGGDNNYAAISPDGTLIAVSKYYGPSTIWDVRTKEKTATIEKPLDGAKIVSFAHNNTILIATDRKKILLYDIASQSITAEITPKWADNTKRFGNAVLSVAYSKKDEQLFLGSEKGNIEIWSVKNMDEPRFVRQLEDRTARRISALKLHPHDPGILITANNQNLKFWDLATKKIVRTIQPDAYAEFIGIDVSGDGRYLIASGHNVQLFDLKTDRQIDIISGSRQIKDAVFLPHSHRLVTVGDGMHVWRIKE